MKNITAILTDFGNKDSYVGVMKGVLYKINPDLNIVDISHEIEHQNIISASYVLYSAWDYFPDNTIFLAVVDPGVGSERNEIIVRIDNKYLIAPDNGLVSLLYFMKQNTAFNSINRDVLKKINLGNISSTFHGRDIFAPAAGLISLGKYDKLCGKKIDPVIINDVRPEIKDNMISGKIIHIDSFGNCISNIHKSHIAGLKLENIVLIDQADIEINKINNFFSETKMGQILAYWGSSDFLEIAVCNGNAKMRFGLKYGENIILK